MIELALSIIPGAAVVAAGYFLYLVATKGLPAALTWAKAKWNSGKTAVAKVEGLAADAQTKVAALEQKYAGDIAALRADVDALKAKVGV